MAERVKIEAGSAYPLEPELVVELRGRNLVPLTVEPVLAVADRLCPHRPRWDLGLGIWGLPRHLAAFR